MCRIKKKYKKRLSLFLVISMLIAFLCGNIEGVNFLVAEASTPEEVTEPSIDGVLFDNESETVSDVGTDANPFKISTDAQLYRLATLIQNGESFENENGNVMYAECSYVLENDINMSFTAWKRIGTSGCPFSGSFDGNNHTISKVNISADTLQSQSVYDTYRYVGVFGVVQDCTIKNLNINSSSINMLAETVPLKCAGLLIGGIKRNGDVIVENCHVTNSSICAQSEVFGVVTTDSDDFDETAYCSYMVGGLIGGLIGKPEVQDSGSGNITIKNCSNGAHVLSKGFRNVGGIIGGMQYGTISDCSNSGVVEGNRNVGGIIGKFDNTVSLSGCNNNNEVTGLEYTDKIWTNFSSGMTGQYGVYEGFWGSDFTAQKAIAKYGSGYYIGGIAGYAGGDIVSAENSGEIKGSSDVGGIAGVAGGIAEQLENTGKISTISYTSQTIEFPKVNGSDSVSVEFVSEKKNVGGIAGSIISEDVALKDCSNQGNISGTENIGGVLGNAVAASGAAVYPVQYSYNAGVVSSTRENASGELIGTGQQTQRSYYLADITNTEEDNAEADGTIEQKSQREFSSGEVCYFLNRDDSGARNIWSQKLGQDALPKLASNEDEFSGILQIKVSTMFSETTWTRLYYCNENDTVEHTVGITEDDDYEYSYYLKGSGGITDLTEVNKTKNITENCHIVVKRQVKTSMETASPLPGTETSSSPEASSDVPSSSSPESSADVPSSSPEATTDVPSSPSPEASSDVPSSPSPEASSDVPSSPSPEATTDVPSSSSPEAPINSPTNSPSSPSPETPTVSPSVKPVETAKPSSTPKPGEKGSIIVKGDKKYEVTGNSSVSIKKVSTKSKTVKIPDTVSIQGKKMKVTKIEANAFAGQNKIETVKIGKNVTTIGKKAFYKCTKLDKITFSVNTKYIGSQCFANCARLKSVSMPNAVQTIEKEAFKNCKSLKTVKIGKKLNTKNGEVYASGIGERMLLAGKLKLKISIGNGAFQNCKSLRSVIINTQVSVIGNSAFRNCKTLSAIIVRSLILKTVGKKALLGVSDCKISVPQKKYSPYRKLFKNKGQGKKVFVAKA